MGRVVEVVVREVRQVLPATIFFLILFNLIAYTREVVLAEHHVSVAFTTGATIGALIVAKVILIADKLPFISLFSVRPLVFDVLWRTFLYGAIALLIQYLEEFIPQLTDAGSLRAAIQRTLEEVSWPRFWAVHLWLLFGLLIYCTVSALIRVIGGQRAKEIFFGTVSHGRA